MARSSQIWAGTIAVAALLAASAIRPAMAVDPIPIPAGYYADQKVVYHNDGGIPDNPTYFKKILGNIRNHLKALGDSHVTIKVADHGDGVVMFQQANTDKALAESIDALRARGVQFLICGNTLVERNIDWHTLYGVKEADLIPSGVAELARLELMGYAYIHP